LIDLINTILPFAGTAASAVAAVVAIEVTRNSKSHVEDAAARAAGYADEAYSHANKAFDHQVTSFVDAQVTAEHSAAAKRERNITASIARSAKKHAQDAKAERLRATVALETMADQLSEAATHVDDAYDHAREAKGHAADAASSANDASNSAGQANDRAMDASDAVRYTHDSAREASAAADRAEEAASAVEAVL